MRIELAPGTLPPPTCYADETERFIAYVAAIIATAIGGIQWEVGSSPPSDTTLYWLVTDTDGRPLYACKYSTADAAWVRLLSDVIWCGDATGTSGNYEVAPIPVFTTTASAYKYGRVYAFKVPHTNPGISTLNVSSLGQRTIKKLVSTDLAAGDILVGQIVMVYFDGTNFQLMGPVANRTIVAGDVTPGTDEQFLCSIGATIASVWVTREYETQTADLKSIPAAGSAETFPHNLQKEGVAVKPKFAYCWIECTSDDSGATGYVVGDRIPVMAAYSGGGTAWCTTWSSSTQVGFVFSSGATGPNVSHKTTGASVAITAGKWKLGASAHW